MGESADRHSNLTTKQELFCMYFVMNDELRDNATMSYAQAYGFQLDNEERYPKDDAVWLDDEEENDIEEDEESAHKRRLRRRYGGRTLVTASSYDRVVRTCAVNSSKLLRLTKIQKKIDGLRIQLLNDESVDSMLAYWMKDKRNPAVSLAAIKEYNKLKARTKDILEISGPDGGPVVVEDKRKFALDSILDINAVPRPASN